MRDRLLVRDIPVQARVGCTEDERREPQLLRVDLELSCDVSAAAAEDRLDLAIDYVKVREEAVQVATAKAYALVETIAERIAWRLLLSFPVSEATVRVKKPSALVEFGVPWAGVEVVRSRSG